MVLHPEPFTWFNYKQSIVNDNLHPFLVLEEREYIITQLWASLQATNAQDTTGAIVSTSTTRLLMWCGLSWTTAASDEMNQQSPARPCKVHSLCVMQSSRVSAPVEVCYMMGSHPQIAHQHLVCMSYHQKSHNIHICLLSHP